MVRLIRIALGVFSIADRGFGSGSRPGLGLGRVGRMDEYTRGRTGPGDGALLHGSGHLQRKDRHRGFDQRGYPDAVERLYLRGQRRSRPPLCGKAP